MQEFPHPTVCLFHGWPAAGVTIGLGQEHNVVASGSIILDTYTIFTSGKCQEHNVVASGSIIASNARCESCSATSAGRAGKSALVRRNKSTGGWRMN